MGERGVERDRMEWMTGTTSGREFEWQLCLVNSSSRFEYEWGYRGISFGFLSFFHACIVLRVWGFRGGTRNVFYDTEDSRDTFPWDFVIIRMERANFGYSNRFEWVECDRGMDISNIFLCLEIVCTISATLYFHRLINEKKISSKVNIMKILVKI